MAMTADQVFSIANVAPLPGWVLLLFLPRWRYTLPIVRFGIVVALASLYVWLAVTQFGRSPGNFNSLGGVSQLFSNPWLLLAGWIHYLAFDLFTGAWIVEDAQRRNISHWFVVPCLPLTLMFGPSGLLLYLVIRGGMARRATAAA